MIAKRDFYFVRHRGVVTLLPGPDWTEGDVAAGMAELARAFPRERVRVSFFLQDGGFFFSFLAQVQLQ